ncbi:MAG: beta-ketoacyl-[acyl-carrier-protein] synthase family protein [Thermoanaerobaculia bacterium]
MSGAPAAITGLGAVSPYGWGIDALWRGLASGETAIRPITRFDSTRHRTRLAAEVPDAGAPPFARRERLSRADRYARAAAAEALAAAGLPARLDDRAVGLFFGSSTGGTLESEQFFDRLTAACGRRAAISLLASQQPNGPADAVARAHGVSGPIATISSACASATLALGQALDALRAGEIDLALVGGADALCQLTFAGFNSLRAVDARPCRPFRAEREGMSIGEGAAVLVVESLAHAAARGARPIALVAGTGASCDAHHMTAPEPGGSGVARAVVSALADSGLPAAAVDFINAHGTGTPLNDAAEWQAIARVFGARAGRIPVTSTKGAVGHYLGAAGAIEALVTVLCLAHGEVHPTPGEGTLDPRAAVDLVVGGPRPLPGARVALSTNFAFGGSNAAAIFRLPEVA